MTRLVYHFSRSLRLSELLNMVSVVSENFSKLLTKAKIPHLFLLGALASSMERFCASINRSKFLLILTSTSPNVIAKKDPVSWADNTCLLNLKNNIALVLKLILERNSKSLFKLKFVVIKILNIFEYTPSLIRQFHNYILLNSLVWVLLNIIKFFTFFRYQNLF